MSVDPSPLPIGSQLAERFQIRSFLGRGGFGIAYLALDLEAGDNVVIKELAPMGIRRSPENVLLFQEAIGPRLRERFLEEAAVLSHINMPGVPKNRANFRENGTAYFATDYIPNAVTLDQLIRTKGCLVKGDAVHIFRSLMDILDLLHRKKILHRDIKPTNILVNDKCQVFLIDFGAAREWHADAHTSHTILFTPGFAPLEQLSERAKRGPATDIYALCTTMFVALTGNPPPSSTDRAAGSTLPSLISLRPDLDPLLVNAIESGLALAYADRPPTIGDLRELLEKFEEPPPETTLSLLDETLLRLKKFKFDRRSCPSCQQLLFEPKPLRRNVCPVCRESLLKRRPINERLCPICQSGLLSALKNDSPLAICPNCSKGLLNYKRKSLLSNEQTATCDTCDTRFEVKAGRMALMSHEEMPPRDFRFWRIQSGRSKEIWKCSECPAQFDVQPDGRWTQAIPGIKSKYQSLYPDEWARIAIGLDPGAGNATCEVCHADYFLDDGNITLLDAREDPYEFADTYLGRLVSQEDVRWMAVGKSSAKPGYICEHCQTEFDKEQEYLRLVTTTNKRLAKWIDRPKKLEDWHRIAQGLPTIDKEDEFRSTIDAVLREAYRKGEFYIDPEGIQIWKGSATQDGEAKTSSLLITHDEIVYGGLLRKRRWPTDAIVAVWADDSQIQIQFSGTKEAIGYEVSPIDLNAHLMSGEYEITLGPRDLAARLTFELGL